MYSLSAYDRLFIYHAIRRGAYLVMLARHGIIADAYATEGV